MLDGRVSLYLDFYPPVYIAKTGKETRREFLKIYLYERPKDAHQKEHNRVSRAKAENIRSERDLFRKWLLADGQTRPVIEEETDPLDCAYPWDYELWKSNPNATHLL